MKKKIVLTSIIALSLALVVAVGVTVAYLFVKSDSVVNTFTPSDIDITLVETPVGEGTSLQNSYQMIPGMPITKDPKVTVTNDIACYVFVKVVESNNFDEYMTYAIAQGWKLYDTGAETINTVAQDTYVIYRELSANEGLDKELVIANNTINVSADVTKDMMNSLYTNGNYPTLTFSAAAVQSANLTLQAAYAQLGW